MSKRCKTEKLEDLEKPLGSTFQVLVEEKIDVSLNEDICTHPGSFGQMCILYGKRLGDDFDVTFGYIHKGLKLGYDEIVRVCSTGMGHLLRQKQLHLILDLDHTLLNSTLLMHLTSAEEYLKAQFDSLQDLSKGILFMLNFMHMMMKLRPFVRSFLNHAKEMFEMHIYTMGDRHYALEMTRLLDPKREYFSGRVISRDDGTQKHQKGLDVVLGYENAIVILDDTENVSLFPHKVLSNFFPLSSLMYLFSLKSLMNHKDNLILVERYHFFTSICHQFGYNCKSLSQLRSDVSELEGALGSVLKVLRQIHRAFFDELDSELANRDVREGLQNCFQPCLSYEIPGR